MKRYRICVRPERAPAVSRVFELSARHTLLDVHHAIQSAFALDGNHPHAFYMSGTHWDVTTEVTGHGGAGGPRTSQTRLYRLGLKPGQRFAYVFDLGAELWHTLEVQAVDETDAPPAQPHLVEAVGDAPPQYPDEDAAEAPEVTALRPLANELVALFPAVDSDDAESDDEREPDEDGLDDPAHESALELEPEVLHAAHGIAVKLARGLDGNLERFYALESAVQSDLLELLADLPVALARAEQVDAGAELAVSLSFLDPPHFLGDRALILAEAGRREQALTQLRENLESQTEDVWSLIKAADVYLELDEPTQAEALLRSALQAAPSEDVRDGAFDRLLDLLASQDRQAELHALLTAERARLDSQIALQRQTVQHFTAKVGRNDPCPCGSGKKHKKCCAM